MSHAPSASSAPTLPTPDSKSPSPFLPLLLWLSLQMIVLLVAGLQIPLSARFPVPAEQLALHEMLLVQMTVAALCLPYLFRTTTTTCLVIISGAIMLQLACAMAAQTDTRRVIQLGVYSALWQVTLALIAPTLRDPRRRMFAVAAASSLVVGGAILAYGYREFAGGSDGMDWSKAGIFGPAAGGMAILEVGSKAAGTAWVEMALLSLLALVHLFWLKRRGTKPHLPVQ